MPQARERYSARSAPADFSSAAKKIDSTSAGSFMPSLRFRRVLSLIQCEESPRNPLKRVTNCTTTSQFATIRAVLDLLRPWAAFACRADSESSEWLRERGSVRYCRHAAESQATIRPADIKTPAGR